jgi:hypothetical protein
MRTRITLLIAALGCTGCPDIINIYPSAEDSSESDSTGPVSTSTESGDGDGDPTETSTGDTETSGDGDGDATTGDGDGDGEPGDGDGEPNDGMRPAIYGLSFDSQQQEFLGFLTHPHEDAIFPHDDIFSEVELGSPSQVFLTRSDFDTPGEWGWSLTANDGQIWWDNVGEGGLLYTEPGCQGSPHQIFAIKNFGPPTPSQLNCENIESIVDQVTLYFPLETQFAAMVDTFWPGAAGLIGRGFINGSDIFMVPRDQQWPEYIQAQSVKAGQCMDIPPTWNCAIRFIDDPSQVSISVGEPFTLVQIPG